VKNISSGEIRVVDKPVGSDTPMTGSNHPKISGDGHIVVFSSSATGLVPSDNNAVLDTFGAVNPFLVDTVAGTDVLDGGLGNDTIFGGAGDDTLTGGAGSDTFFFRIGGGNDLIMDFTSGADSIAIDTASFQILASTGTGLSFEDIGANTYDGTNATTGSNVILDETGNIYVDINDTAPGGYSVIANVGVGTTVIATDIVESD